MSFIPKPQEIYRHFKGNLYQITAIAEHTETGETLVVYQALYGDFRTYARPLAMFTEVLDRERYPDVEQVFRFELQGADAGRQIRESQEAGLAAGAKGTGTSTVQMQPEDGMHGSATSAAALPDDNESKVAEEASVGAAGRMEHCGEAAKEEITLDPLVLEFLDSDTYEQRLNILAGLHHRITNDMITTMAIACDVEINEGDVEERYEALKACLLTLERYECNRLR